MADKIKKDVTIDINANLGNIEAQLKDLSKKMDGMKLSLDMSNINTKNINLLKELSSAVD